MKPSFCSYVLLPVSAFLYVKANDLRRDFFGYWIECRCQVEATIVFFRTTSAFPGVVLIDAPLVWFLVCCPGMSVHCTVCK